MKLFLMIACLMGSILSSTFVQAHGNHTNGNHLNGNHIHGTHHIRPSKNPLKTVILIPFDETDTTDQIFVGGATNFWYQLKQVCASYGYQLTTNRTITADLLAVVAFNAPKQSVNKYGAVKKILYTWEPHTVAPENFDPAVHKLFDLVMTWNDALIDGKKYQKFNYALQFGMPAHIPPFAQRNLCTFLGANKHSSNSNELYTKRLETVLFFEKNAPQEFDFYGPGWPSNTFKTYGGYVQDKIGTLMAYKFSIAYENMANVPGYITEKIFDSFSAGCVPVYWGASNIDHYIPKNCYIARQDFASEQALYTFLKTMPEHIYNGYIRNIRAFLASTYAVPFSREQFLKTFIIALHSLEDHEPNSFSRAHA